MIAQTADDQTPINWYRYSPYGEVEITGDDEGNPVQYTGRENDQTGLYYYRARYYDPVLKRFISRDPIGLAGGINFYGYVDGDPVSLFDPWGFRGENRGRGQMGRSSHAPGSSRSGRDTLNILIGSTILTPTKDGLRSAQTTGIGIGIYTEVCINPKPKSCEKPSAIPDSASLTSKMGVGLSVSSDLSNVCVIIGPVLSLPGVEWDTTGLHR